MELRDLIAQGEHQQLDFKFRVDDARKIARTLTAFANTDGGRLLIGVKDNGKVAGCNPNEEFHIIDHAAVTYCKPEVKVQSHVWQEGHKLVLEIRVEPSKEKPHKSPDEEGKWVAYVRVKDSTLLANKILLRVWNRRKNPLAKPETMSEPQVHFLRVIEIHQPCTLSKLYRLAHLPKKQVDDLLVTFICWNLVAQTITPEGTFYQTI